jgi:hypothetical protein
MRSFLHFEGQTTNACAFLLINGSLNEDKELNVTTNHRSPRAKIFANYALKTRMEGIYIVISLGAIMKNGRGISLYNDKDLPTIYAL